MFSSKILIKFFENIFKFWPAYFKRRQKGVDKIVRITAEGHGILLIMYGRCKKKRMDRAQQVHKYVYVTDSLMKSGFTLKPVLCHPVKME